MDNKKKIDHSYINENILRIRKDKLNINQEELCNLSGVSQSTLSDIEGKNKADFRVSTLLKISKALKVSILELVLTQDMFASLNQSSEQDVATIIDIYDLITQACTDADINLDYYQHQQATQKIYSKIKTAEIQKTEAYQKSYILKTLKEMFNID